MDEMRFVNLTPYAIRLRRDILQPEEDALKTDMVIPPSGKLARIDVEMIWYGRKVNGFPVFETKWGKIQGLPRRRANTIYIVSMICARHTRRRDVLAPCPDSSAIRTEDGKIFAVRGFCGNE